MGASKKIMGALTLLSFALLPCCLAALLPCCFGSLLALLPCCFGCLLFAALGALRDSTSGSTVGYECRMLAACGGLWRRAVGPSKKIMGAFALLSFALLPCCLAALLPCCFGSLLALLPCCFGCLLFAALAALPHSIYGYMLSSGCRELAACGGLWRRAVGP